MQQTGYKLVQLVNGTYSIHSIAERETFHPVIGPAAEAEALYVKQLKLRQRLQSHEGDFVIWDVGLGAAANVLTVLRATEDIPSRIRILSFDKTLEPLRFALEHAKALEYFVGYESQVETLLETNRVAFATGKQNISWEFHPGDFPALLAESVAHLPVRKFPAPHAILFDAFSPAKNPTMWTEPLFANLFRMLDPQRPCAIPTYSRSTLLRVTLLLAGFFVGVGHATGKKEETSIAANTMELLDQPLSRKFLVRARISDSAEPLWEPVYRQAPVSDETWDKLQRHPQFKPD